RCPHATLSPDVSPAQPPSPCPLIRIASHSHSGDTTSHTKHTSAEALRSSVLCLLCFFVASFRCGDWLELVVIESLIGPIICHHFVNVILRLGKSYFWHV